MHDPSDDEDLPLVSVAVSTHNRCTSLLRLLGALEQQTLDADRFEVVVVDDASSDDTAKTLADFDPRSSLRLRTLRLDRNRGQAVGRNEAWRNARAPVIAFTDDDCTPTTSWLEEGLTELRKGPGIVIGATQPDPAQRHLLDPLARTVRVTEASRAPTCNAFYLASDLETVGGFDETFGATAGEDTDLAWRIQEQLGRELRFSEPALVHHDVRPRSLAQALREAHRWEGIARVVARHPELARKSWWYGGYFLRPSHPWALLAASGLALAIFVPPTLLLTWPWLRKHVLRGRPGLGWVGRLRYAPALLIIDLHEIWVLARASVRHRALIL